MKKELKSFLGTGWAFPPVFYKNTCSAGMVSEIEDIKESIRIILDTFPGERIMQPEFGCTIKRLVFEKNDSSLNVTLSQVIEKALLNFEPRVKFISTEIRDTDASERLNGYIRIIINFSVIITNTRHNIVYPFYLNEGTNVHE